MNEFANAEYARLIRAQTGGENALLEACDQIAALTEQVDTLKYRAETAEEELVECKAATEDELTIRRDAYLFQLNITLQREEEIRKLKAELAAMREAQRWIPVSERLPEQGWYWVFMFIPAEDKPILGVPKSIVERGYFNGENWNGAFASAIRFGGTVTHYMPNPEPQPPQEGGEG